VWEELNHPHIWAQVEKAVELLLAAPTRPTTQKGFDMATIAGMFEKIDVVPAPDSAAGRSYLPRRI